MFKFSNIYFKTPIYFKKKLFLTLLEVKNQYCL